MKVVEPSYLVVLGPLDLVGLLVAVVDLVEEQCLEVADVEVAPDLGPFYAKQNLVCPDISCLYAAPSSPGNSSSR